MTNEERSDLLVLIERSKQEIDPNSIEKQEGELEKLNKETNKKVKNKAKEIIKQNFEEAEKTDNQKQEEELELIEENIAIVKNEEETKDSRKSLIEKQMDMSSKSKQHNVRNFVLVIVGLFVVFGVILLLLSVL